MICGWKQIQSYTGRSRNTIKKLVESDGFPVRTIMGKPTSTKRAIERWFEDRLKVTSTYEGLSQNQISNRLLVQ